MPQLQSRKIIKDEVFEFEFSICTLVTNLQEYGEMYDSFIKAGFTTEKCEYLYIDNSEQNTFEAFKGLNRFLREAKGEYIILCHQDILLQESGKNDLQKKIKELEQADPNWAVLGNAGSVNIKYRALHITHASGKKGKEKYLPIRSETLDENFLIVKSSANLALSGDLAGFHMYGADICLIADILGYRSYVIEFRLLHKSDGNADEKFYALKRKLIWKYARAFRSRFMGTTVTRFYLSGNKLLSLLGNTRFVLFAARQYYKIFKPKKIYHRRISDGI
ncbi:MAG: hypothetical protein JO080_11985 [Mucilaginibacter sp.]|nr:hypothetical protein [Mucilaginibacter sp.]